MPSIVSATVIFISIVMAISSGTPQLLALPTFRLSNILIAGVVVEKTLAYSVFTEHPVLMEAAVA